ncbi:hypothetical protein [Paenibacillus sp. QZ-Y1]|uniref:hypothetical protein n=1 Tax=Paenibacillus sp. QZ-Y1 TaxID=3414511 RepID=UPI003F796DC1
MSHCSILMNEQKVFIAADSRKSNKIGEDYYWIDDDAVKLYKVDNDKVIFVSGHAVFCDHVINTYLDSDDHSINNLQTVIREMEMLFKEHFPSTIFPEKDYFDCTMVAMSRDTKGNSQLKLYSLNQSSYYNPYEYLIENKKGYTYATAGVFGVKATALWKQIRGKYKEKETFKKIYDHITCEAVGGKVSVVGIDKDNGIFHESSFNIEDKKQLRKLSDYESMLGHYILGNKLMISDDKGNLTIEGSLISIKDDKGQLRAQFGEYKDKTFGFRLFGSNGTVVVDENGIVQTDTIQIADNVDSTHTLKLKFHLSPKTIQFRDFQLNFSLERFRAYSKGAASANIDLYTTESERILLTTTEEKSFNSTTTEPQNVSGTTQTEGVYIGQGGHNHGWPDNLQFKDVNGITRTWKSSGNHQHFVSLQPHNHEFTVPKHAHNIDMPSHRHRIDVPPHSHPIEYGIFEGTMATGVRIIIDGITRGGVYSSTENNVDVTPWIQTPGWHTIELSSQQLGRINASLYMKTFVGA